MAQYYNANPYRGPVLAEDGIPDFERLSRQTADAARLEQEQMRRAGEQQVEGYRSMAEDYGQMIQAPMMGYREYQAAKDRNLDRQRFAEESEMRQQQIAAGKTAAEREKKFGERKTEAEIRQMESGATASEAQAQVAKAAAKRADYETASLEKWTAPGSAKSLIPGAQAVIAQYNLPEDLSAEDFLKTSSAKLDLDTAKRAEVAFQQAREMFPLQLKQLGQQIQLAGQTAKQGQYLFDRQALQDRVSDAATMLSTLENKAQTDQKSSVLYQQTLESMDPKTRSLVEGEMGTRKASKRLQDALAEPTLDPVKYAQKQKTVEDYMMVNDTAKTVNQLIGLVHQYKQASTLFWDNEEAEAIRGEIAQIAADAGYPNLSDDILSGVSSGATVETTMNRLVSIIGGKALTAARSANAAPETQKMASAIREALADMKIRESTATGYVTSQGLRDIANKRGKGFANPPGGIPAQQTPMIPPQKFQLNYQQQNKRPVPPANKGG